MRAILRALLLLLVAGRGGTDLNIQAKSATDHDHDPGPIHPLVVTADGIPTIQKRLDTAGGRGRGPLQSLRSINQLPPAYTEATPALFLSCPALFHPYP